MSAGGGGEGGEGCHTILPACLSRLSPAWSYCATDKPVHTVCLFQCRCDGSTCNNADTGLTVVWPVCCVLCVVCAGHVDCARCLVEAGADVQAECDGCPALILAVSSAVLPGREAAVLELVQLLLGAGADAMQR